MKGLDCFVCTLPCPCSAQAMKSQRSDGLHVYYVPIDWCVLAQGPGLQKGAEIMLTCSVPTGLEMPERLLEGVIDSGEPVDVRVGVLEGVPDLLGTRGRGSISRYW